MQHTLDMARETQELLQVNPFKDDDTHRITMKSLSSIISTLEFAKNKGKEKLASSLLYRDISLMYINDVNNAIKEEKMNEST